MGKVVKLDKRLVECLINIFKLANNKWKDIRHEGPGEPQGRKNETNNFRFKAGISSSKEEISSFESLNVKISNNKC